MNDDNRPLYSGSGCKQWLSGMWACRLTQRTDFAYEKLRWQPKDCEMDDFTGSKFLMRYYFSILLTLRKVYIQNTVALIFHMGVLAWVSNPMQWIQTWPLFILLAYFCFPWIQFLALHSLKIFTFFFIFIFFLSWFFTIGASSLICFPGLSVFDTDTLNILGYVTIVYEKNYFW